MIAAETLDQLADAALRVLAPPPRPRSLLAFARSLRLPDGPQAGEAYEPTSHPAGLEILRAFAAGGFEQMVTLGPVQDGKTWATIIVPLLYTLAELRQAAVYGLPDRALAGKVWRSKLRPTIEACGLGHLLPTSGPGSDGGAPEDVLFTTGARLFMLGAGARNEAGQAAVTAPFVAVDERDSIRPRWVELLNARADAFDIAARRVSTSTIKHDAGGSTTWSLYAMSTSGRLWFRCPRCRAEAHASGGWQAFEWDRVEYDPTDDRTAAATVRLVCAHVAEHRLTDDERRAALLDWRLVARGQSVAPDGGLVGELPPTSVWGLRWTALDSPLKSLPTLAVRHRQACQQRDAEGNHEALRQFYRDQLAAPYRDDLEGQEGTATLTPAYLQARANVHGWADLVADKPDDGALWSRYMAPLPDTATCAVATIDVQSNRCYWLLTAADADLRTYDAAWGYEHATADRLPTSTGELHAILDRIADLLPSLVARDGAAPGEPAARPPVPIVGLGVDVGYRQPELVAWLAGRPSWVPIAGAGEDVAGKLRSVVAQAPGAERRDGDMLGVLYRRALEGARLAPRQQLHLVDVDRVKEQAVGQYLRPAGSAGAAHLPRGLKASDAIILHLTGEQLVESDKTGRRVWRVVRKRHDYLDLRTYNLALLRLHLRNATLAPMPVRARRVVGSFTPNPRGTP